MPGDGWWRIASRHHGGPLILPPNGDPELDRFYLAALARDVLNEDVRARNRALQRQIAANRPRGAKPRKRGRVPVVVPGP